MNSSVIWWLWLFRIRPATRWTRARCPPDGDRPPWWSSERFRISSSSLRWASTIKLVDTFSSFEFRTDWSNCSSNLTRRKGECTVSIRREIELRSAVWHRRWCVDNVDGDDYRPRESIGHWLTRPSDETKRIFVESTKDADGYSPPTRRNCDRILRKWFLSEPLAVVVVELGQPCQMDECENARERMREIRRTSSGPREEVRTGQSSRKKRRKEKCSLKSTEEEPSCQWWLLNNIVE